MIGNRRNFPAALVVPNFEHPREVGAGEGPRLRRAGRSSWPAPRSLAHYQKLMADLLPDLAQFERIKKIALLAREFTLEAGELTPTLKVKRRVVEQKYKDAHRPALRGRGLSVTRSSTSEGRWCWAAGTMGAQVAAHLVAQGLEVALLDLPSPAPDRERAWPGAGVGDPQEAEALPAPPARARALLRARQLRGRLERSSRTRTGSSRRWWRTWRSSAQLFAQGRRRRRSPPPSSPRNTSGLGIAAMTVAPARGASAGASSARTSSTRRAT